MTEEWIAEFDLLWGIAPSGTPKHDKGESIKKFIRTLLSKQREEMVKDLEKLKIIGGQVIDKANILSEEEKKFWGKKLTEAYNQSLVDAIQAISQSKEEKK